MEPLLHEAFDKVFMTVNLTSTRIHKEIRDNKEACHYSNKHGNIQILLDLEKHLEEGKKDSTFL